MSRHKKYSLDPDTLLYVEEQPISAGKKVLRWVLMWLATVLMFFFYLWIYTSVFHQELPKTLLLKKANAKWISRIELMDRQLDVYDDALSALQGRDDGVYRTIFGLSEIPSSVRNAGFGGVNRYSELSQADRGGMLLCSDRRLDVLVKKAYIQSKSFDEVGQVAHRAGDMVSCIPAVPPISPNPARYRKTSGFGYRRDPVSGHGAMHQGTDFACKQGYPVYTTGDGVVEMVSFSFYGYGNCVIINHGFGYKTMYAHLKNINVSEGMVVKRGKQIGTVGNTGKSTGSHLHYEVKYKGKSVNPANFFDMDMPQDEYDSMVANANVESSAAYKYPTAQSLKKYGAH